MPSAEDFLKRANFERKNGHFPQAEALYLLALEKDPAYWNGLNNLRCLYLDDLHEYAKAEEIFKKCIAMDPNHEWGYSNLACVYCEKKQWELAKKYAEIALNMHVYGDALVSLGRAKLGLGQPREALRILQRAANIPQYPYPHFYLAQVYEQLNDPEQVITFLQHALSMYISPLIPTIDAVPNEDSFSCSKHSIMTIYFYGIGSFNSIDLSRNTSFKATTGDASAPTHH